MTFSPQSKVWVYQSNRPFSDQETESLQKKLAQFTGQWSAHGRQLSAKAEIWYGFFIVFIVDETTAPATGCSIDSSVRVIKEIEQEYGVDLFSRFSVAYRTDDKIVVVTKEDFETLVNIKAVGPQTIVFNNMVQTLEDFQTKWEVPFAESWHQQVFSHLL